MTAGSHPAVGSIKPKRRRGHLSFSFLTMISRSGSLSSVRATAMLLLRLWRRSRMWFRFSDSFPFQFRFLAWWKKLLWELAQQPPPPHVGAWANAGRLVIIAPAVVAMSMPPTTHVF